MNSGRVDFFPVGESIAVEQEIHNNIIPPLMTKVKLKNAKTFGYTTHPIAYLSVVEPTSRSSLFVLQLVF
jgi:hypothetical protein